MLFYKDVERWEDPIDILNMIEFKERATLMNKNDLSFVCGLLRTFRPKKIVEIGIAYGGTTAIIVNAISKLGYECEMHSIDILNDFRGEVPGSYLYRAQEYIDMSKINHSFHLGNVSPAFLDEIGKDVDFLVLDTAHGLPGELLEFITCFPYLADNAVVVLHDVVDHCTWRENNGKEYATQLLFDTVVAEKYMNTDDERCALYPNIAAFRINEDTAKYISDCFGAMTMTWLYMPDDKQYNLYRESIRKNYASEYVEMMNKARELNCVAFSRKRYSTGWHLLLNDKMYIYGAGVLGKRCLNFFREMDIRPIGIVISDGQEKVEEYIDGIKVYKLSEIEENAIFVLAVSEVYLSEIMHNLKMRGIRNCINMRDIMKLITE